MRPNTTLATRLALVSSLVAAPACFAPPDLDEGSASGGRGPGASALVTAEPPAPLDALPRVVRLTVRGLASDAEGTVRLFDGELSDAQCGLAAAESLPSTLASRLVPAASWSVGDGVVLAPTIVLTPGRRYTLTHRGERLSTLEVASDDALPVMALRWPPNGASPTGALGVWCGDAPVDGAARPLTLAPSGLVGTLRGGIAPGESAPRCVHFEPAAVVDPEGTSLPPPLLEGLDGEPSARLEPAPMTRSPVAVTGKPLECGAELEPFGPGCARVEDDRILLALPEGARLYSVQSLEPGLAVDHVFGADGGRVQLWPLPPSRAFWLAIGTLDAAGGVNTTAKLVRTRAPMAHLVIDELLANPIGPEPAQEWVELVNDGLVPAHLGGLRLADVDGEVALPSVDLPPGRRALLVNESYDASGKYDPPPAEGAILVRLPKLAKSGLANGGEPLELRDPSGHVLSSFPAIKGKPGRSVFRVGSKSLDRFATSKLGGSTPGATNEGMVESDLL